MREEFLDCYADYIVKFIKSYAKHGIKISAVTPQNECNTQQSGRMPACIWHPETEAKFIKILRRKFDIEQFDTKIWMYDHNFNDIENRVVWSLENCPGLVNDCDGVALHYYDGTVEKTENAVKKFFDLSFHFTEGGPRLYDHYDSDFCKWGIMISKVLSEGFSSFTGFASTAS